MQVALLLDNPVLDLGNPDCLDLHVSWNKIPKKDLSAPFIFPSLLCEEPLFVCLWVLNDNELLICNKFAK